MSLALADIEAVELDGWRLRLLDYASKASSQRWKKYRHLEYLTDRVQRAVFDGDARVIVNMPPRHGKSQALSRWLPTWFLDWNPDKSVILASYGDSLAKDFGRMVRDYFMEAPDSWAEVRRDKEAANDWATTEGGGMKTVGVGGPITGLGGDLIIVDDPHKNFAESQSVLQRRRIVDWFNATLYTRAEPGASIVVVQTRWHEDDLTGYLVNEHQDDWEVISLPALAEEKNDALGRAPGEALCPARYTAEALDKIKEAMGSFLFAGLYQQRPAPPDGGIIKREWIKYYTQTPPELKDYTASWDMSFKETSGGSYTVGQVWARDGADIYLLDQFRKRIDFPAAQKAVVGMAETWPAISKHCIEDAANGPAIISSLRNKLPGIIPIKPQGSKAARLHSVAPLLESGNVWLPHPSIAPWVGDLVLELITFPSASHDDQCDALSMALSHYRGVRELIMC